jgi:acyl-CoA-dependent ceramide synthase
MIVKVAINVLKGGEADDVRSDDEGDADEEEETHEKLIHAIGDRVDEFDEAQPFEEEVGVEAINLKGRTSTARYRKSVNHANGVSLPGHSDRKELLGRIGCDKPV